jgi:hypothetical protein
MSWFQTEPHSPGCTSVLPCHNYRLIPQFKLKILVAIERRGAVTKEMAGLACFRLVLVQPF